MWHFIESLEVLNHHGTSLPMAIETVKMRSVIAAIVNKFCNVDRGDSAARAGGRLAAPSPQIQIDLTVATAMEATTAAMETTSTAVESAATGTVETPASVVRTASTVRAARPVSTATAVARAGPIARHRAASGVAAAV